jgi:hypothetical protein
LITLRTIRHGIQPGDACAKGGSHTLSWTIPSHCELATGMAQTGRRYEDRLRLVRFSYARRRMVNCRSYSPAKVPPG